MSAHSKTKPRCILLISAWVFAAPIFAGGTSEEVEPTQAKNVAPILLKTIEDLRSERKKINEFHLLEDEGLGKVWLQKLKGALPENLATLPTEQQTALLLSLDEAGLNLPMLFEPSHYMNYGEVIDLGLNVGTELVWETLIPQKDVSLDAKKEFFRKKMKAMQETQKDRLEFHRQNETTPSMSYAEALEAQAIIKNYFNKPDLKPTQEEFLEFLKTAGMNNFYGMGRHQQRYQAMQSKELIVFLNSAHTKNWDLARKALSARLPSLEPFRVRMRRKILNFCDGAFGSS